MLDFGKQPDESRRRINSWIEKQTNDKIKDMIPPNLLDDNTMFFCLAKEQASKAVLLYMAVVNIYNLTPRCHPTSLSFCQTSCLR
jgi:hypothetical protein